MRIRSLDGKVSAKVEPLYVEYLEERYLNAGMRIKGEFEPIVFMDEGQIRASLMPRQTLIEM